MSDDELDAIAGGKDGGGAGPDRLVGRSMRRKRLCQSCRSHCQAIHPVSLDWMVDLAFARDPAARAGAGKSRSVGALVAGGVYPDR
jgi:hypothetical protein